jgi:hypothetical protein
MDTNLEQLEQLARHEIDTQKDDKKNAVKTWRDENWVRAGFPIDRTNALLYFCNRGNPFYDKRCNNEQFRMQQRDWSTLQYVF